MNANERREPTMTTSTSSKPRKSSRKPKVRSMRYDALVGTLYLTVDGKDAGSYWLDRLDAGEPGAVAVRLTKFVADRKEGEPENYDVRVGRLSALRSCECKGFCRHGHCKHSDALAALVAAGKLS